MSTAVEKDTNLIPVITKERLIQYMKVSGVGDKLTDQEKEYFIEIAILCNLNPFKNEIYPTIYGKGENRKLSIITGYEVYIKRANRTSLLNGWKVDTSGSVQEQNLTATITIYRKDWDHPYTHTVEYREYKQSTPIWNTKPKTMLEKVVTAQGFRLCFPNDFDGMPYTNDELPPEMSGEKEVNPIKIEEKNKKNSNEKNNFYKMDKDMRRQMDNKIADYTNLATSNRNLFSENEWNQLVDVYSEMPIKAEKEWKSRQLHPVAYVNNQIGYLKKKISERIKLEQEKVVDQEPSEEERELFDLSTLGRV